VKIKLNALKEAVNGKRVVMIDDSIVRGTTSKRLVQILRDAGAKEVHMRISSPLICIHVSLELTHRAGPSLLRRNVPLRKSER